MKNEKLNVIIMLPLFALDSVVAPKKWFLLQFINHKKHISWGKEEKLPFTYAPTVYKRVEGIPEPSFCKGGIEACIQILRTIICHKNIVTFRVSPSSLFSESIPGSLSLWPVNVN